VENGKLFFRMKDGNIVKGDFIYLHVSDHEPRTTVHSAFVFKYFFDTNFHAMMGFPCKFMLRVRRVSFIVQNTIEQNFITAIYKD
jgi:hypothetical protein